MLWHRSEVEGQLKSLDKNFMRVLCTFLVILIQLPSLLKFRAFLKFQKHEQLLYHASCLSAL